MCLCLCVCVCVRGCVRACVRACVCVLPTVYTSSPGVRSGPNLAHTCRFISNGSELNKNQPRVTQEGFGFFLGGQKFHNLE